MTVKKYKSGLTLIVERNEALRSVTSGIMVGAGSAYECARNNGISHFIEHMQFKGTEKRTAQEIVGAFDRAGSVYNAFTGKEYTCYYFKSIDEKVEDCFEVLADLFLNSVFDKAELDRERKVILEEINMSLDEPDGVCYDVLYRAMFGEGSLGMEILGPKENVSRFTKADIAEYKSSHYLPSNTVVAFVGNITEAEAEALVLKHLAELADAEYKAPPVLSAQKFNAAFGSFVKDYEQSEISVAFPSFGLGDARAQQLSALDCILGNGMSSRLFQRLREQLGLVYSVYTSPWMGKNNGVFSVCANVNVVNVAQTLEVIKSEIDAMANRGVTEDEAEKAKTQLKVALMFGKENPMNYMLSLMRWRVLLDREYDLDGLLARIEDITPRKINDLAAEILTARPAIAYVGKDPHISIEKTYFGE
ncbi:MAG: insulinase family protein [Roseburia sp.]|nr:insulinase family protein [Roseburia sp.]